MSTSHDLMGGVLHVYKRENSRFWQCSAFLNGRNHRVSSKQESLAHAKDFAEDWFLELKGKIRSGEAPAGGVTFNKAADAFLREFLALTAGERSPIYVVRTSEPTPGSLASLLRKEGALRNHSRSRAGVPHPPDDLPQRPQDGRTASTRQEHTASRDCLPASGA
jgi:hypothetical protein